MQCKQYIDLTRTHVAHACTWRLHLSYWILKKIIQNNHWSSKYNNRLITDVENQLTCNRAVRYCRGVCLHWNIQLYWNTLQAFSVDNFHIVALYHHRRLVDGQLLRLEIFVWISVLFSVPEGLCVFLNGHFFLSLLTSLWSRETSSLTHPSWKYE